MLRIGVVGSRGFKDKDLLRGVLDLQLLHGRFILVSGGARGVDQDAAAWAHRNGLPVVEHYPDWSVGNYAAFLRNQKIVDDADVVLAFWDGKSKGTRDTILRVKKAEKHLHIFREMKGLRAICNRECGSDLKISP